MCVSMSVGEEDLSYPLYLSSFSTEAGYFAKPEGHLCFYWVGGWQASEILPISAQWPSTGDTGVSSQAQLLTCVLGIRSQVPVHAQPTSLPTKPSPQP